MDEKKIGQRFVDCYGECPSAVDAYEVAARIPDHIGRDERLTFWEAIAPAWAGYDSQFGVDTYRTAFVAAELLRRKWLGRWVVTSRGVGVVVERREFGRSASVVMLRVRVGDLMVFVQESKARDYHAN